MVERPPNSYGQRLALVEGPSAKVLTCHFTDKAGYIYSAPLHICRVVLLLLRQRSGADLGKLQRARGRSKYFPTAPAHTQRALHGSHSSRGWSPKTTYFSRLGYTRTRHLHFLFSVPSCYMEFITFLRSSPHFFSRLLPASSLLLRVKLCTCRRASAQVR